jgi:hypothetical protein
MKNGNGGHWRPTTKQLEIVAMHGVARSPPDRIARDLNITESIFRAWSARLTAAREWDKPQSTEQTLEELLNERRKRDRIIAERSFHAPPV